MKKELDWHYIGYKAITWLLRIVMVGGFVWLAMWWNNPLGYFMAGILVTFVPTSKEVEEMWNNN
jgi:hypothetical protein